MPTLTIVQWLDHTTFVDEDWNDDPAELLDRVQEPITSVGFLYAEDDTALVLVGDLGEGLSQRSTAILKSTVIHRVDQPMEDACG